MTSDGGKGSAPRKQQDQEAYSNNYDVIFNRHKRIKSDQVCAKTDTKIDNQEGEQSENSSGHRNDNGSQDDPRSGNEGH